MDPIDEWLIERVTRYFDRYDFNDLLEFNEFEDVKDLVIELVKDGYLLLPEDLE